MLLPSKVKARQHPAFPVMPAPASPSFTPLCRPPSFTITGRAHSPQLLNNTAQATAYNASLLATKMSTMLHFDAQEHTVPACHIREYAGSTARSQEEVFQISVKQYTPKEAISEAASRDAITFIAANGCGLPRETYEPLWDDLYERAEANGFSVRGIWMADAANVGYSGILNEGKYSSDCSWMDHARDLLLIVNHFRDQMPRPLVGVGHSYGGCQIVNLAYLHPRLFTTLLLLDPVIQLSPPTMGFGTDAPGGINFMVHRKDTWPNRAIAAATQAKMSKDWDPRVLDRMVEHGFRELPTALYPEVPKNFNPLDPPVTLTTTKFQDSLGQLRENFEARQPDGRIEINRQTHADMDPLAAFVPLYRPEPRSTYYRLPSLRPSTLWVLPSRTFLNLDEMREGIKATGTGVGGSGGADRVKEVLIKGHVHLLPFTAVGQTADACAAWLKSELTLYRKQEAEWNEKRAAMTPRDHLTLPPQWAKVVKPLSAFKGKI